MRILLLNQCFHPDHVATALYLTDLATALVEAGHDVTAIASSRGYDDPTARYPTHEEWRGIHIRRIWTPGLGKTAKWRRAVDFATFWINATWTLLTQPRADVTVCLTSPPLISTLGTVIAGLKGGEVVPWVMDLNPDEAVAAGWLRAGSLPERIMTTLQNWSFGRARRIIALDRFMAERIMAKGIEARHIHVDAPWVLDDAIHHDPTGRDSFRRQHHVQDKFVVMYSGNHSPCHPLHAVLETAQQLHADDRIHFMFIGGGSEQARVRAYAQQQHLTNITCLPYQPLDTLSASLSAADLHLVVMGDPFVGMVHPCKVYNILALGLPWLGVCSTACHLSDLAHAVHDERYATTARNGDVPAILSAITRAAATGPLPPSEAARTVAQRFSRAALRARLVQVIEKAK